MKKTDHSGRRVERLLYLSEVGKSPSGRVLWRARCDCGQEVVISTEHVRRTKSCGCLARETTAARSKSHGATGTKTHNVWNQMRRRCRTRPEYAGITVCARWESYENFLADMGECPTGMSIDREDPLGNYEPSNCRWATAKQQANNRTNNHRITIGGVTKTAAEWSAQSGVNAQTIIWRSKQGWADTDIL